ncbi:MAG: MFS transporter [Alphaproteobacteria bacterium]
MTATLALPRHDFRIIGLLATAHGFSHFYMVALPPLFPLLKAEMGVSYAALGAIASTVALASGLAQLPVGFIVDRFGARYVVIAGSAVIALAYGLMGFAPSYAWLPALAALAGLANSVFHPADYAILSHAIDPKRVGRAFGIHTFSGYIGWALAPLLMASLAPHIGWRGAIMTAGVLGLAMAAILFTQRGYLSNDIGAKARGTTRAADGGPRGASVLLRPGVLVLFGFFVFSSMNSIGINTFSVTALHALHDLDLRTANVALTAFLVGAACGVFVGGFVVDRTTRYEAVAGVGFTVAAAGVLIIAFLPLPAWAIIATLGLTGSMIGGITPSRDMLVRAMAPKGSAGKVFGFVSTGIEVGSATSPVLFGWLLDQGHPALVFIASAIMMMGALAGASAAAYFARRQAERSTVAAA